ncbi:hypothetical protein [Marinobacterium mangrovicola]|uniref:Uncharacterized protein n=1 Tax=Marinobacterium mangrovicola TaxID=1476959 RepID=A0A4V2PDN5_9GAMM|nr:hypothetical protein [Marinobacterium mangrovicola]TCK05866.1 hypothetical protein CLV83_2806 [Marinobacterium mangrovicola]
MKELLYAVALCIALGSGYVFSEAPSEERIDNAWSIDAALANRMIKKQEHFQTIGAFMLAGAAVFGLAGFAVQMREKSTEA